MHGGRQCLLGITMDWTGVAHMRSFGFALLDIPVTVDMEIGLEDLESLKSTRDPSL